jgi:anaerobic selenocysteine-containing dehydrogenase
MRPSFSPLFCTASGIHLAMERVSHRICPLCEATCGLEITTRDDKVVKIRGHEADVFSEGFICPKGAALGELHEDPDRLRRPLLKRDGAFVEVSWDEAFAEIERRLPPLLAAHGRDAVALSIGNPAAHKVGLLLYGARLGRALGTKNIYSASTLDQMPKQLSVGLMFGQWLSIPIPDLARTDLLLILGANPVASNGSLWTVPDFRGKAKAMQARGGKLIVVDPRRSETAELADSHLFIRPGGDAYLLAGIIHTLYAEGLTKLGLLAEHTNGVDELRQATAALTPEAMAPHCGIAAAQIRELARTLAAAERACVYGRIGTCVYELGTVTSWLVDAVNVLIGQLDSPGGAMFSKAAAFAANTAGPPGRGKGVVTGRRHSRVSGAPEVYGEFPMTLLAEEIETPGEGQIRALITVASNPVLSSPGGARLAAAFERLDFMVSLDIYLNETSRHADVILPGLSPLEDVHFDVAFPQFAWRNAVRFSEPTLPRATPTGDGAGAGDVAPAEWETMLRLIAIVTGKGAGADLHALDDELAADDVRRVAGPFAEAVLAQVARWRGPERLVDLALRGGPYGDQFGRNPSGLTLEKVKAATGGVDLGELAPRVPEMLRTSSGKIELAPPMLLAELARTLSAAEKPAPALAVIGRRQLRSNNSWMHNLPSLAKGKPRCTALVHPDDAARLGLADAGRGRLRRAGERGGEHGNAHEILVDIEVSDEMMPGVISLPHGWGHDLPGAKLSVAAARPGANLNAVLDDRRRDPLSGNAVLGGVAVELLPVAD